jgi:hypothetical protein
MTAFRYQDQWLKKYDRTLQWWRFMVAKILFGLDRMMTVEEKTGRIALLSASLLTLVAISCASLGLWRVGTDLDWAGDFVVQDGLLSHWQVWIGFAVAMQYTSWWLARHAGLAQRREAEIVQDAEPLNWAWRSRIR